jgi:hypothetical protein
MGNKFPTANGSLVSGISGTGGEHQLQVAGPLSTTIDGQSILVHFTCTYTPGATIIKPNFILRRSADLSGVALYTSGIFTDVTAVPFFFTAFFIDVLPTSAPVFYALSIGNNNSGTSVNVAAALFAMGL